MKPLLKFAFPLLFGAMAASIETEATIVISTAVTWSSSATLTDDVQIVPGGSLTITGATITVNGFYWIRVEDNPSSGSFTPGGRLVMNNSTLTSSVGWDGILVIGNSNSSTLAASQSDIRVAKATLTNSTIEGAEYGICNWDRHNDYSANYSGGGIIQATSSNFHDNGINVWMQHYQNSSSMTPSLKFNDYSNFNQCTFSRDFNSSIHQWAVGPLVRLHEVEGVTFFGCTYTMSPLSGNGKYTGVRAVKLESAGAIIKNACNDPFQAWGVPCSTPVQSVFNNIAFGVEATGPNTTHKVQVSGAQFNDCLKGVFIQAYQNPWILQNHFDIYPDFSSKHSGIAIEGTTGFRVEDNTIDVSGPGSESLVYGIEITSAGEDYNEVFHNTINNSNYALEANKDNRSSNNAGNGLKFLCNLMTNVVSDAYDIVITGGSSNSATNGIGYIQGEFVSGMPVSASNGFSTAFPPGTGGQHIYNAGPSILYYTDPLISTTTPTNTSGSLSFFWSASNSCPSKVVYGGPVLSYPSYLTQKASLETSINGSSGATRALYLGEYRRLNNEMLHVYAGYYDSTGAMSLDSMSFILSTMKYEYDYQLMNAGILAQQNLFTAATDVLDSIASHFTLDVYQQQRVANIRALIVIADNLNSVGNDWNSLSGTDQTTVATIASTDDFLAQYMARYFLTTYDTNTFEPNLVPVLPEEFARIEERQTERKIQLHSTGITLFPNPATTEFKVTGMSGNGTISISDVSGRMLEFKSTSESTNLVNISKLASGIYSVRVSDATGSSRTFKLIKQ